MQLPDLRIAGWRPTKDTLHLYAQIVGKMRLAATPPRNHWWHAPLYVDVRGLTTGTLRRGGASFAISFDLVDQELVVRTIGGASRSFALADGLSVAEFDGRLHAALADLGVDVEIDERPFGVPAFTTPFREDTEHASWDREAVVRFHRALDWASSVMEEFSGRFVGKQSPVQLFWQSFDLSLTRFSGRPGLSLDDVVNREAYTHEVILFGFWMGDDETFPDASFYAFMQPSPVGWRETSIAGGQWTKIGLTVLPWETVRAAPDPRALVLAFLQSAYEAAAGCAGWDLPALASAGHPVQ